MRSAIIILLNSFWWMSCLPAWFRFRAATRHPRKSQERVLRRQARLQGLSENEGTYPAFTRQLLTDYEDYREKIEDIRCGKMGELPRSFRSLYQKIWGTFTDRPVVNAPLRGLTSTPVKLLEPTSGSRGGRKLVPYTAELRREFQAALGAWIGDLYRRYPGLLRSTHYWSISPSTAAPQNTAESAVRVGFAADEEYLAGWQRFAARRVLAVPPEVRRISDPEAFELVTVLFLLRDHRLGLISVWHPSFLRLLSRRAVAERKRLVQAIHDGGLPAGIDLPGQGAKLVARLRPLPGRARCVDQALAGEKPDWRAVWPRLQVISCWADARAGREAEELLKEFPGVDLQPKGLLATEGVVTIPWGKEKRRVCVPNGHFLEFADTADGTVHPLWDLMEGREYTVILTTGNGFRRYRLGDVKFSVLRSEDDWEDVFAAKGGTACALA